MSGPAFQVGTRIGDYQLERELGKGGMGAVYVARHVGLGAEYALKVQLLGGGSNAHQRGERFAREARALAKVDRHPGIVGIHHFGLVPGDARISYCVLDLVDGGDLSAVVSARALQLTEVLRWGAQIARALAHVHAAGVVHRDLKPANILIRSDDGAALLTDFGLARDASEEQRLTVTGQMLGTLHYMAPEQITGQHREVGPHTDVFALGAVLFELLTGRTPFDGADNLVQLSAQVVAGRRTPPSAERRDVPPDLDEVVVRALAAEPAERPTAAQIAEALERIARGEPIGWERRASSVTSGVRSWASRVRRREPRTLTQLLAIVVLASLVVGLALYQVAVERPRARALASLEAHLSWEAETLTPLRLGVRPGEAPPLEELARRLADLERIASRVPQAEVEPALARLRAHRRWRAFQAGEPVDVPAAGGRDPIDLVVDALILRERGDASGAWSRAELAGSSPAARLLRIALTARARPQAFLASLDDLAGEEASFARALAPQALEARWRQVITSVAAGDPTGMAESLELLGRAATLAGDTLPALKRATLETSAPAWEGRLRAAGTEAQVSEVARLADLVETPPRVEPGPRLRAVLERHLASRLGAALAGMRANRASSLPLALAALRVERILFERITNRLWAPTQTQPALDHIAFSQQSRLGVSPELILACVRYGIRAGAQKLAEKFPESFPQAPRDTPRGRAIAFCLLFKRIRQERARWRALRRRGGAALTVRSRVIRQTEQFLTQAIGPEIVPRYWGQLWHQLATMLDLQRRRAKRRPERLALARRLVQATGKERELRAFLDPSDLFDTCAREASANTSLGEPKAVKAVWAWACRTLGERLGGTSPGDFTLLHSYARSLYQQVLARWALEERSEELVRLAETALRYGEKCPRDRWFLQHPAGWLASRCLEAGQPQRALAFVERALPEGLGFPRFVSVAVQAAAAAGKPKRARALLRKALAKAPRHRRLLELERELGDD